MDKYLRVSPLAFLPCELVIHLFALLLTFQIPQFVSWRPEPLATFTDDFSLNWKDLLGYTFPLFALIRRCLRQIVAQEVSHLVLVTLVWPTQLWYPLLLDLCVDLPLLLPVTFGSPQQGGSDASTSQSSVSWVAAVNQCFRSESFSQ